MLPSRAVAPSATGANWRSISSIRAPIVNEPRADRSRALDDARVVEVAARQAQQVVAERDHGEPDGRADPG